MNSAGPGSSGSDPDPDREDSIGPMDGRSGDDRDETPTSPRGWARYAMTTDRLPFMVIREVAVSVAIVAFIGIVLFSLSGVWPPMVAIESGSMEPHMSRYDLVFVTDTDRFEHDAAVEETGIVPYDVAVEHEYVKFGDYGDVIVFMPNGEDDRVPIIHRAYLWVEGGENWYDRADPARMGGADSCEELRNCPAPHDGFITIGDANGIYDQVQSQSEPVKPEWVVATANVRVPYLGWIRLTLAERGILQISVTDGPLSMASNHNDGSAMAVEPAPDRSDLAV